MEADERDSRKQEPGRALHWQVVVLTPQGDAFKPPNPPPLGRAAALLARSHLPLPQTWTCCAVQIATRVPLSTALRLGGYPFVGNSEMAPFFWLAPGGANFLLCLLLRRHCCSAYLLSKTQEVLFWPCLSVRSTPFTCLERAQRREIALVAEQVASSCKGTGFTCPTAHRSVFFRGKYSNSK